MERHVGHAAAVGAQRRALRVALLANGAMLVVQVVGGLAFGSLALLADSAHLATDVVALAVALVAQRLSTRPVTARHSFGLQRAEVLGALGNALLLIGTAAVVVVEAVRRLGAPAEVAGGGLVAVAVAGLAVNLGSAALLARAGGESLNLRAARAHLLADAAGSLGALVAGVLIVTAGLDRADPVVSLLVAGLVLRSGWRLLRDTAHVLLEGTPAGLDPGAVEASLRAQPEVESVHHLHLWSLASDQPALSAHVVLRGDVDLHEAQRRGDHLKQLLDDTYGITHTTLELECHRCEDPALHRSG